MNRGNCIIFYLEVGMESIRILSNIQNFIPIAGLVQGSISLQSIQQFRQIFLLINEFISNQFINPRCIFEQLYQFINKEEQVFGPRKFKKMIYNISNIIFQFILRKMRKGNADIVILCLTYYHKYCSKYFTIHIQTVISLIYALTHFKKNNISISLNYINQSKQTIRTLYKDSEEQTFVVNANSIIDILEAVTTAKTDNLTRAKFILNEVISRLTEKMHEEQRKSRKLNVQTISYFTLATFYISNVYQELGDFDKSAYHITQCKNFSVAHLAQSEGLHSYLDQTFKYTMNKTVKLGRIQNKIERIKSLHNFNSINTKSSVSMHKQNSRAHFKISKKTKDLNINQQKINNQLKNLFVLQQTNEVKLKKKTLRGLHAQQMQKEHKIHLFQNQIGQFIKEKKHISKQYQNQIKISEIKQIKEQREYIKSQISEKIWEIAHTLKATKKIQSYLASFRCIILYQTTNKFFKFLYNQVSFKSQIKLFSFFRKLRSQLMRELIRSVTIRGIKHQIQFARNKINKTYHIKIYQIQKGQGINRQKQVKKDIYEELKTHQFFHIFQIYQHTLVPLKQYLTLIPKSILTLMKLFYLKLWKKIQYRKGSLLFEKKQINITFNTYFTDLTYTVFITSRKDGQIYHHQIQRIDCRKFNNNDYNIKFRRTVTTSFLSITQQEVSELITSHIIEEKSKYVQYITRIQRMFRVKLSKALFAKKKETIQVTTSILNRNVYSIVSNNGIRNFYIENLDKKFPTLILKDVNFCNLSFIQRLRQDLLANDDGYEHLKLIKKHLLLRSFACLLIKKSQQVKLDTKFSTKFKKSLCFAKIMKQYLYRGKLIQGRMMYMLTVNNFETFPRPYMLRVFTIQHKNLYLVDFQQIIFNNEKIYLQSNLQKINLLVDIQEHRKANILFDGPMKLNHKTKRTNSKSTLVSNFSFGSGQEFLKERQSRLNIRILHSRQSNILNRNKKNSINFKMRHKSALKQKDIMLIKKWIEQNKEDSSIQQSEQSASNY